MQGCMVSTDTERSCYRLDVFKGVTEHHNVSKEISFSFQCTHLETISSSCA